MDSRTWYQQLIKPSWAPPASVFGPVWTVLYLVIALSFGVTFVKASTGSLPWIVALPFILNLVFNAAFTPLQFGLRNNLLALMDIVLILGTLVWALASVYPYVGWVTWVNLPYLLWVSFATALQAAITSLNWK
jgi:benzodiazapine receptor